jgi:hypothetical protein
MGRRPDKATVDTLKEFYGENFEYSYGSFYFADVFRRPSGGINKLTATMLSAECAVVDDYSV